MALGLSAGIARAQDQQQPAPAEQKKSTAQPAPATGEEEMKNARALALEGSKSPWSGQLQLTYLGSSLNHPFSDELANPSHQDNPSPVSLSGVVAIRYRFNDTTTMGLGTGVSTETPIQGQKHTTVSDPQVDFAKSFLLGPIHNRADLTLLYYTNHYETEAGMKNLVDLTTESFYESKWGLTSGLALEYGRNQLKDDPTLAAAQVSQYFLIMPYFEYAINDTFNLRTIWHFTSNMKRSLPEGKWYHPDTTQNVGLGISASKAVFLYVFLAADPYAKGTKIAADTTTLGLQAIINLF